MIALTSAVNTCVYTNPNGKEEEEEEDDDDDDEMIRREITHI